MTNDLSLINWLFCLKLVAFFPMDVVGPCVMILIMDATMKATDAIVNVIDAIAMTSIVMDVIVIVIAAIAMDVIVIVIAIVIAIEHFKSQGLILWI